MTGVFQTREYQQLFAEYFCQQKDIVWTEYGGFELMGEKAVFLGMKPVLGGEEVTDYGDIEVKEKSDYGKVWIEIKRELKNKGAKKIQLDYLREDSQSYKVLSDLQGPTLKVEEQEVAPYLKLPTSWDEYLMGLKRKYRKELKRKIKRLEEKKNFYRCQSKTMREDFEEFIRLHRLSDPEKNKFMSEKMKKFFWAVKTAKIPGWQAVLCFLKLEGKAVAAVMKFESKDEVWLYNSGYDPEYAYYSVGLLLKAYTIKSAIETGKKKYDFLRGGERYKYELGARDLQLYRLEMGL